MKKISNVLFSNIILLSSIFVAGCNSVTTTPSIPNVSTTNPSGVGSTLIDEDFATLDGWKLENGEFKRNNNYSTFEIKDSSKKMVLSINHLSTKKDKNYKILVFQSKF